MVSFTSSKPVEIAALAIAQAQGEDLEDYHWMDAHAVIDALERDGWRVRQPTMILQEGDV